MIETIAMILAGGQGSRLSILADHRAKPAVPFGGIYRIIDFTMSNVMHAKIPVVGVLTQYKPYSLMDHISTGEAWGYIGRKHHAKILPPYIGEADSDWYAGTADAIYQNLNFMDRFDPEMVFVLSGDHIYKMDYNELLAFHKSKNADLTIAMQEVPWEDVHRFGIAVTDSDQRIVDFVEKSKTAPSNLASLGIYLFNRSFLERVLNEDAEDKNSQHDFGKNVIPNNIKKARVFAYIFKGYWRDVGTIDAYWNTHQEALNPASSGLDLEKWNIRTNMLLENLANLQPLKAAAHARIHNSIIAPGCLIEGEVSDSILSSGVRVMPGAKIEKSIILHNVVVGEKSHVNYSILDKDTRIGNNCRIGEGDSIANKEAPHILSCGITVFGKYAKLPDGCTVGKNCLIYPVVEDGDYSGQRIESGETIRPKCKRKIKIR